MYRNLFSLTRKVEKIDDFKRKHIVVWSIPDIKWLLNNQTNRDIRTKRITDDDNNEESQFQVKIQFVGRENDLIEVYYMTLETAFVEPNCNMWIKDKGYALISTKQSKQLVPKNEWQLLAVMWKKTIVERCKLNKNTLSLKFEFLVFHTSTNIPREIAREQPNLPDNREEEINTPNCNLVDDVTSLLMSTHLSDVTVKSLEGEEFPAHKLILSTRSTVFKAHFEHNTVESLTNVVESPFETKVLESVLNYLYTDKVPEIYELSGKLLKAADFYHLNGLKKLCEIALVKKLSVENAIETLELANLRGVLYLKKKTLEFIKDGLARDITKTEGWRSMNSAEIFKSIYEDVVENL